MKTESLLILQALSLFVLLPTLVILAISFWRDRQDKAKGNQVEKPKSGNYFKTK